MSFHFYASNNTNGVNLGQYDDEDPTPSPFGNGLPVDFFIDNPDAVETFVNASDGSQHWNGTSWEFLYDVDRLKAFMNAQIEVNVSYDNGTTIFTVLNDDLTRQRLTTEVVASFIRNDDSFITKWQVVDDANGKDATAADLEGILLACSNRLQKCYAALATVQTTNSLTPYTFENIAEDDLLTAIES